MGPGILDCRWWLLAAFSCSLLQKTWTHVFSVKGCCQYVETADLLNLETADLLHELKNTWKRLRY
jgi:hypothetical protein